MFSYILGKQSSRIRNRLSTKPFRFKTSL